MKDLPLATLLLILFSCNGQNNPTNTNGNDSLVKSRDTVVVDSVKKVTQSPPINISERGTFWKTFKGAMRKMDTTRIIGMVNFPYIHNRSEVNEADFKEYVLPQLTGMEKATKPVGGMGTSYLGSSEVSPTDSIYYTNFNHVDIYFGKVNGYYKLVETITPG